MDYFRRIADILHLLAIVILLSKMLRQKSAAGISLRTQFLYAVVFLTRYIDLFYYFISPYNTFMKLFFITSSIGICCLMRCVDPWKATHDKDNDTFRLRYLIVPCAILALLFHPESLNEVRAILWAFSEFLEAVAILPQLYLLEHTDHNDDPLISLYIFTLAAYRLFYIVSWLSLYITMYDDPIWISLISGIIQTLLYCDFFFFFNKKNKRKETAEIVNSSEDLGIWI